jgi:transaldolase
MVHFKKVYFFCLPTLAYIFLLTFTDTMNECEAASCDVMTVPDNTSSTKQLQSKSNTRKSLNSATRKRTSGPINQQSCASTMKLTDNTLNQSPRVNGKF